MNNSTGTSGRMSSTSLRFLSLVKIEKISFKAPFFYQVFISFSPLLLLRLFHSYFFLSLSLPLLCFLGRLNLHIAFFHDSRSSQRGAGIQQEGRSDDLTFFDAKQHKTVPLARALLPLRRDYCAAELKDKKKRGFFFFSFSLFIYLWLDSSRRRRRRRRGIIEGDGDRKL